MINVSNEYRKQITEERQFKLKATLTLADGTTKYLEDGDIFQGGMSFDEATSNSNSFQIGFAYIGGHKLVISNFDGKFDDYDFTGATVVPFVGLQLSEAVEWLKKGVFTVDDPGTGGNIITLDCLDNMHKFEKPFSEVEVVFPTTAQLLLTAICIHCGVPLATTTFYHDDYVINDRPIDDALSCIDMVSYIAQITGNYAKCNVDGALELKWYDTSVFEQSNDYDGGYFDKTEESFYQSGDNIDGGNFIDYSSGDNVDGGTFQELKRFHHFYDFSNVPTVSVDDVVITGIRVVYKGEEEEAYTALFGTGGYVLSIEDNPLIQSHEDADKVANAVGAKIVGMRFRPFSANVLSDPSVQAGDPCIVSIRTSRGYVSYQSYITSLLYTTGQRMVVKCIAETPSRNSSKRYSAETKAVVEARKRMEIKLTAYDLMVKQLNDLVAHSFGVYRTEVVLEDGSTVFYMHDKPTLAESQKIWKQTADAFAVSTDGGHTYTAGFDADGNAVFNVLAAIGINADWITAGKLLSKDGATLIDLDYGVANSDNLSFTDNIQSGFPLIMPFNIDDNVSKINKVLLKYTQQPFRTYSTTASDGGSSTVSSSTEFSVITTQSALESTQIFATFDQTVTTSTASGTGSHSHTVTIPGHAHSNVYGSLIHNHAIVDHGHSHNVNIPSHTHGLNFGIKEQGITNYAIDIYIDGVLRAQVENSSDKIQGILDLTQWITTTGWHVIEIRSATLKRVSAQINIKSYIRS